MRFLKKKIAMAEASKGKESPQHQPTISEPPTSSRRETRSMKKKREEAQTGLPRNEDDEYRSNSKYVFEETMLSTKNLAKNFGKAICTFASSKMAASYLKRFLEKEDLSEKDFLEFVEKARCEINGLFNFRRVLLPTEKDSREIIASKRVFVLISEVFIKFFSVNWIFNGKVIHKLTHLHYRFKMLRRIKCPELFTYIRTPKK